MAQALCDLNIVPEVRSRADNPFPDPYLTMSYRNDQDSNRDYVSASLAPAVIDSYPAGASVWNPGPHEDPFPAIIEGMRPPRTAVIANAGVRLFAAPPKAVTAVQQQQYIPIR